MPKPVAFISHVARDTPYARKLVAFLRSEGTDVWWAHDTLLHGDSWADDISRAIARSTILIALVSPDFLASPWGMFEVGAAMGRRWDDGDSLILPVLIRGVRLEDLPGPLRQFQILDTKGLSPHMVAKRVALFIKRGRGEGCLTSA